MATIKRSGPMFATKQWAQHFHFGSLFRESAIFMGPAMSHTQSTQTQTKSDPAVFYHTYYALALLCSFHTAINVNINMNEHQHHSSNGK